MAFRLFLRIVTVILLFTSVYLCVYLIQSLEESRRTTNELNKANEELFRLRKENSKLETLNSDKNHIIEVSYEIAKKAETDVLKERKMKQDLQNLLNNAQDNIQTLEAKLRKKQEFKKHSIRFEMLRRKISNQIKEMSFYISSLLGKLRHNEENSTGDVEKYLGLGNFEELQRITESDFDQLMKLDNAQGVRDQTAKELSDIVVKRLHNLQHPQWCRSARKLVCRLKRNCGYGCQIHRVLFSFIVAYATKRTLIIDSSDWLYSNQGWNAYFQPVSTSCIDFTDSQLWHGSHEEYRVVELPQLDFVRPRLETMPLAVPRDLYDHIRSFHGQPFVWWVSQFTKYLLRLNPQLKDKVRRKKTRLQFKGPIVGVHVRRTDKVNVEASFHSIEEYMYHVDLYYKKLELSEKVDKKRVFLATDDPSVLPEAKEKYPDYVFLSDNNASESAAFRNRYASESLYGIITDIELLSDTDFLVCTFSSQVCRLAYEIMNSKHTDASQNFRSLDDIYYFGGQQEHRVEAIWPHYATNENELNLTVGDIIAIAGNHWNGQSMGRHHGTQRNGLFPSYKVKDVHDVVDFPYYNDD